MKDTIAYIRTQLQTLYSPEEATCFVRLILSHVCRLSRERQLLLHDIQLTEKEKNDIRVIVSRLKNSEPLQYIIGETEFYSLSIEVNTSTLIPRPETEELTDMIVKRYRAAQSLNILDIGTGSGCIAIALAKHLSDVAVTAIDISAAALSTASRNARRHGVDIRFMQADILQTAEAAQLLPDKYHVIVSNPPYIAEDEKPTIDRNVLDYEPSEALFVANDDPLLFYKAIIAFAQIKLVAGGSCYFEINHKYASELKDWLEKQGYDNFNITRDLSGKNRFLSIQL